MAAPSRSHNQNRKPNRNQEGDEVPRSVGRVLDLLEVVVAGSTSTLTAAATATGLTPTTALRYLRALEVRGYLDRDEDGRFTTGPTLRRMASGLLASEPIERILVAARPRLEHLSQSCGESTYLAMGDGTVASYVALAEGTHAIRHVGWVGQQVTLDGTAVGQAFSDRLVVAERTGAVQPDITAFSIALPTIEGIDIAVSVLGPEHRMNLVAADLREQLIDTARLLSADLGIDSAQTEAGETDIGEAGS